MRAILIAIGNTLRRDDGAAHRVLQLLGGTRAVVQLTPEIASEIGAFDRVMFIDADVNPGEPRIEPIAAAPVSSPLAHVLTPAHVVMLSERLYGFRGNAFLCRIPGVDFGIGEGLSPQAEANVASAAALIAAWLHNSFAS